MRRTFLRAVLMTGAAFVSLPFLGAPLAAHDFRAGDLVIDHPWTRAVGAAAPTAAGYMIIRNTGAAPDRLVAAETPRAARVELHEMSVTDGIMRMRPIAGGIALPPGGEVRLAPGGLHLMLMRPLRPLAEGDVARVRLVLEDGRRVFAEYPVRREAP